MLQAQAEAEAAEARAHAELDEAAAAYEAQIAELQRVADEGQGAADAAARTIEQWRNRCTFSLFNRQTPEPIMY